MKCNSSQLLDTMKVTCYWITVPSVLVTCYHSTMSVGQ